LLARTAATQKLKPTYIKSRVPPVSSQKRLAGSSSEAKKKLLNESSDSLQSSEVAYSSRIGLISGGTDHNGNGEQILTDEKPGASPEKIIPKMTDSPNLGEVDPLLWDTSDVSEFLRINDCGAYCDSFDRNVSHR
jgi:hypothetical protein